MGAYLWRPLQALGIGMCHTDSLTVFGRCWSDSRVRSVEKFSRDLGCRPQCSLEVWGKYIFSPFSVDSHLDLSEPSAHGLFARSATTDAAVKSESKAHAPALPKAVDLCPGCTLLQNKIKYPKIRCCTSRLKYTSMHGL
jgi:hypothetical protein